MKLRWFAIAVCLWPLSAAGQARIDQLGAAAAVGDTDKFPVCQGCGAAINALEATGTQLKTYFNGVYPQRTNNLSDLSNFLLARENLGFPDGTSSTVLHGAAGGAPTYTQVLNADIATNTIALNKLAQSAANTLLCNATAGTANVTVCTLSARFGFSGSVFDIAAGSIGATQLASGAAATNLGAAGGDLSGTYPSPTVTKVNGANMPAAPAVHQYPIATSAASGGTLSYKTRSNCPNTVGSGNHINFDQSTDSESCGTDNGVSLTAAPGLKISPTPYNIGAGVISPSWPVNQTCKTTNYTLVEADSATSLCFSGTNLTLTINSSASNYLPAGEGITVSNQDSTALTVAIGTGSSIFKNSPGTTTSFTITQFGWAIIQSDGAGSPNNYWVFPSGAGGGGGASGALTKISTQTASNSATLDFTGLGTTYNHLLLDCNNIIPASNGTGMYLRVGTGSTTWSSVNYDWRYDTVNTGDTTTTSANNNNDAQMVLSPTLVSNDATYSFNTVLIDIWGIDSVAATRFVWQGSYKNSSSSYGDTPRGGGSWYAGNTITGIRFLVGDATNISSGSCTLYGYAK